MAKSLTTKLYEGKFKLFGICLFIGEGKDTAIIQKTVVGTAKTVRNYIANYLKPSYKKPGKKLRVEYTPQTGYFASDMPIDIIAVPTSAQAT